MRLSHIFVTKQIVVEAKKEEDIVRNGDVSDAVENLRAGVNVDVVDENGQTPLHKAAKSGSAKAVKSLLDAGADMHVVGRYGQTPLHEAAKSGNVEVVKLLLGKGAGVNAMDERKKAPLHEAVNSGNEEVVKLLLNAGAGVNVVDGGKKTPLYEAVNSGNVEVVKLLLDAGADAHVVDWDKRTPLHEAAKFGNVEVVKLLLDAGADVHVVDWGNRTTLHWAAYSRNAEVVKLLLAFDAGIGANFEEVWEMWWRIGRMRINPDLFENAIVIGANFPAGFQLPDSAITTAAAFFQRVNEGPERLRYFLLTKTAPLVNPDAEYVDFQMQLLDSVMGDLEGNASLNLEYVSYLPFVEHVLQMKPEDKDLPALRDKLRSKFGLQIFAAKAALRLHDRDLANASLPRNVLVGFPRLGFRIRAAKAVSSSKQSAAAGAAGLAAELPGPMMGT